MDIKKLVDRFLGCPVPTTVRPDNLDADGRMRPGGSGTNLLSATEAEQMLRYVLADVIEKPTTVSGLVHKDLFDQVNDELKTAKVSLKEAYAILERFDKHPMTSKHEWHNRRSAWVQAHAKFYKGAT